MSEKYMWGEGNEVMASDDLINQHILKNKNLHSPHRQLDSTVFPVDYIYYIKFMLFA